MDTTVAGMISMITTMALPFVLAVTVPIIVKAYLADYLGDHTPRMEGRLSFDPLKHADPMGTGLMPLISVISGLPILLGWPKPLMVNPANFKTQNSVALYAISGSVTLLLMALIFAMLFKYTLPLTGGAGWLGENFQAGTAICCVFAVLHLLPIPPNDGALFIAQFMPRDLAEKFWSLAPYGFFIFLAVILLAKPVIFVPANTIHILVWTIVGM